MQSNPGHFIVESKQFVFFLHLQNVLLKKEFLLSAYIIKEPKLENWIICIVEQKKKKKKRLFRAWYESNTFNRILTFSEQN